MHSDNAHDAAALLVPEDLRTAPGANKSRDEEAFYTWAYPEPDFFSTPPGRAHQILLPRVSEPHRRLEEDFAPEVRALRDRVRDYHQLPPLGEADGTDLTEAITQEAHAAGLQLVGFTHFDRMHVYSNHRRDVHFRNLIITGLEQPREPSHATPNEAVLRAALISNLDAVRASLIVADFIRGRGYRVQFVGGAIGNELVKMIPYGIEAGLGQLGANGQLLSPFFGSRWRPIAMSTDAPVTHGKPQDFGIPALCEKCQVCIRRCPGRAIPKQKVSWRGVVKHKILPERCIPIRERYSSCGICVKVCPIQEYGLEAVLDHYRQTGQVLGKGTDELEGFYLPDKGYFGSGQMPRFAPGENRIQYELLEELPEDTRPMYGTGI